MDFNEKRNHLVALYSKYDNYLSVRNFFDQVPNHQLSEYETFSYFQNNYNLWKPNQDEMSFQREKKNPIQPVPQNQLKSQKSMEDEMIQQAIEESLKSTRKSITLQSAPIIPRNNQ